MKIFKCMKHGILSSSEKTGFYGSPNKTDEDAWCIYCLNEALTKLCGILIIEDTEEK